MTDVASVRRTKKVAENVAWAIAREIVAKRMAPGTRLPPEAEMLAQYEVARSSLREALRVLEIQGVITMRIGAGGGPVVGQVSAVEFGRNIALQLHVARATFHQLLDARCTLEPIMARRAAQLRDEALPARLFGQCLRETVGLSLGQALDLTLAIRDRSRRSA